MLEIAPMGKCVQLLPVLDRSTLNDWFNRIKKIRTDRLSSSYWSEPSQDYGDVLLNFMLGNSESNYFSDRPGAAGALPLYIAKNVRYCPSAIRG